MRKADFVQHYANWEKGRLEHAPFVSSAISHILKVSRRTGKENKDLVVLDVGSAMGQYSFEIAKKVKKVVGVEPYKKFYEISQKRLKRSELNSKISFFNVPIEKLKTKEKFDLVLCLATIEHMPDRDASFKKIFKLLRKGGLVYITVPSKTWPYEYHYRLWFLSWLPIKWANRYVRFMKRGRSFNDSSYSMSYSGIIKFFRRFPCKYKFIVPELGAKYLDLGDNDVLYKLMMNIGVRLLRRFPFFWTFSKAFLIILIKQ